MLPTSPSEVYGYTPKDVRGPSISHGPSGKDRAFYNRKNPQFRATMSDVDYARELQVGLDKPRELSSPVPEAESEVETDPALHLFGQKILKTNCAHCKKHLIYSEKDVIKLTKKWLTNQAPVDSVLVCGKCSKSTCVGCGTLRSSYPATSRRIGKNPKSPVISESADTPPVWCCDDGRLFLIWALLCTSEHQKACIDRRDSYFTRSRAASDPPKPVKPIRKSNGTGYGDSHAGGYFPGGSAFESFPVNFDTTGEIQLMPTKPSAVKRRAFQPSPAAKKPKESVDAILEPALRNLAALLPKLEGSMRFDHDPDAILISMIQRSPILEKAVELLRNESLDDITKRKGLYDRLFDFTQCLASHPATAVAVFQKRIVYPPDSGLLSISFGERKYDLRGKTKSKAESAQPLASVITNLHITSRKMLKQSKSRLDEFQTTEGRDMLALCSRICEVADFLQANGIPQVEVVEDCKGKGKAPMKQEETIESWHRNHCVDELPDDMLLANFYYSRTATDLQGLPPKKGRMKHLMTELSTLQTALPEGIYVRHGSSRLDIMKVLILGPKDTPYEGGLFEFDLLCPLTYPHEAPKMQFKTTGGGAAHFNPNLYADGKGK
jgi:hypothetical protein